MVGHLERHQGADAGGSRTAQRLPHMPVHDVAEIDREVRDALSEAGEAG